MGKKVHKKELYKPNAHSGNMPFNRCLQQVLKDNKMSEVWSEVTCQRCLKTRVEKEIK